ncbi:hypothetical protein [Bradyrhizobium guangdongense]|uniref:Uncharacterized protein n=1 Tax=Bradyrhizobium guangdongense TaxID=1325090 RepID=A0A410V7E5_9BRAD|nr:hypothetical protein [Bradyrhizobium guangdongense]QAU39602.1 hypothetical protein X265_19495 [Bradyrhizobium guangdongense]QOZ60664.1 hypothetical protein XH86_19510 [Bradyrhizobium guangdongense]GGI24167.1 hypothetical protein GCM10010987_28030 [Bradyrhizobium guangdongense]
MTVVDVWNADTFDSRLIQGLGANADLMLSYFESERCVFLDHDLGRNRSLVRPGNPHAQNFVQFAEALARTMEQRTIRAWHYTRLTDVEVETLRCDGVHLSTPESLQRRLAAIVASGAITNDLASDLYSRSPFQSEQREIRINRFWMTSHPVDVRDGGVDPLTKYWGGEVASMFVRDEAMLARLALIGRPRVVELAVPVKLADAGYSAARAVIATFARSRGAIPDKNAFDLRVTSPLPAAAVLAVHTAGDTAFDLIGRSYPTGYIDVQVGRWNELTGED